MIVEAEKSEICRPREEPMLQLESKASLQAEFPPLQRTSLSLFS